MDLFASFDRERCDQCGECFHQCPVLQLPIDTAKIEIGRLLGGKNTEIVLQKCESCFACNFICPREANPTQLILERWHEQYTANGLPLRGAYYSPHKSPNFRSYVVERMPADEQAMIDSWKDTSPAKEIFYPGCNWITAAHLAKTKLIDGLTIRGSLDLCCGETYYRMGLFDQLTQVGERLKHWLDKMGTKKILIPCTAGLNMFTNVLPKFGMTIDVEIEHILPWLLRRLESGEIDIKYKFDKTATIQESCYGKIFGEGYMNIPRKILELLGIRVIEQKFSREMAVCCGIAGGFSNPSSYHPLDITRSTLRSLKLAKDTGADMVVSYCAGCMQMLSVGQVANPLNRMPVYHILELLMIATGEQPIGQKEKRRRALTFLAGVTRNQIPVVASKKRVFIDKIEPLD